MRCRRAPSAQRRRARRPLLPADGAARASPPTCALYSEESFGPLLVGHRRSTGRTRPYGSPTTPSTASRRRSSARTSPAALELAQRIECGHLPHQRHDRPRRAADAVRRRQGERLRAASAAAPRSRSSPSCAGSPFRSCRATTRSDTQVSVSTNDGGFSYDAQVAAFDRPRRMHARGSRRRPPLTGSGTLRARL